MPESQKALYNRFGDVVSLGPITRDQAKKHINHLYKALTTAEQDFVLNEVDGRRRTNNPCTFRDIDSLVADAQRGSP